MLPLLGGAHSRACDRQGLSSHHRCVQNTLQISVALSQHRALCVRYTCCQPAPRLTPPAPCIPAPAGIVAASKDAKLAREIQALFASETMRVNTTTDLTGVEICGALKNVLAIAAGIAEGLDLGNNAMAALIAQGCAEIR